MKRLKAYIKKIYKIIIKPEMSVLPGQIAFFIIMAVFPMLTLFGYIGTRISLFSAGVISALEEIFPANVLEVLLPFVTESHFTGNIVFFLIMALILISNGTHSIIIASNEIYGIRYDDFIKRRIKAFLMIVLLMILVMFMFIVLAYGNIIVHKIFHLKALVKFSATVYSFFVYLKWPIAFIFIFICIKLLYTIAPDKRIPSKFMNKGALFTTLGFMIMTAVYSYYVSHFANYSLFYGSISGIIALMIWVYSLSFILVMGIAINSEVYEGMNNS